MKYKRPIQYILEQKSMIKHIVRNGYLMTYSTRGLSSRTLVKDLKEQVPPSIQVPTPSPDLTYLLNKINRTNIIENLSKRTEITLEKATNYLELLYQAKEEVIKAPNEENRNKLIKI